MIRITTRQEQDCTVVIIDGQVVAADVSEIQRVRTSLTGAVTLKLGGVTDCVAEGVRLLRDWLAAGAKLQDATLFLRMILEDTTSDVGARMQSKKPTHDSA
jgi:predicted thioredoxin/glutaredoxin